MIPLRGLDLSKPEHWPYFLALLASPFVLLACIATFFGPGWFVGAFWIGFVSDLVPEEVEAAASLHPNPSREARPSFAAHQPVTPDAPTQVQPRP
jgi:hypothetical protein